MSLYYQLKNGPLAPTKESLQELAINLAQHGIFIGEKGHLEQKYSPRLTSLSDDHLDKIPNLQKLMSCKMRETSRGDGITLVKLFEELCPNTSYIHRPLHTLPLLETLLAALLSGYKCTWSQNDSSVRIGIEPSTSDFLYSPNSRKPYDIVTDLYKNYKFVLLPDIQRERYVDDSRPEWYDSDLKLVTELTSVLKKSICSVSVGREPPKTLNEIVFELATRFNIKLDMDVLINQGFLILALLCLGVNAHIYPDSKVLFYVEVDTRRSLFE